MAAWKVDGRELIGTVATIFGDPDRYATLGQVGNIKTPAYLLAALSIVTIEARHAGAIGSYLKHAPTEIAPSGSFDTGLSAAKVLAAVKATGFIVS